MNDDRALAEETTYYVLVSGCGSASTSFTTVAPSTGASTAWPVPFNAAKWGNRGWPYTLGNTLDPKGTVYVDPLTGVKLTAVNGANDFTWRYPGGGHNPVYPGTILFSYYGGGTGWSNPGSALSGASSTASTGVNSPIDLYPGAGLAGSNGPWWAYWTPTNDLGVKIWAGCSVSGGCPFTICLFTNPSTGCLGTPVAITAPQGSVAPVASGSSDPDTPWPSSFPSALFSGWGSGAMLGQENFPTGSNCTLSASAGVLTVDPGYQGSSACAFSLALAKPGNKIYVAGSSPACTNSLCTVASLQNGYSLTTSESVTVPTGTSYLVLGWGVRVTPALSSGTLTIGAAYKQAGTEQPAQTGAGPNAKCNSLTFASSTGTQMRLCTVYGATWGADLLWGFGTDGTSLPLWSGTAPSTPYFTGLGFASGDIPNNCTGCSINWGQFLPGADAYTWYLYQSTQNNSSLYELYKLTYDGNASEGLTPFNYTLAGDSAGYGPVRNGPSDYWTWAALTPGSSNLATQIATLYPRYNSSLFGTRFGLSGVAGTGAYFNNTYAGQNYGAWIATMDLSTTPATLSNLIHTVDGTGTNGHMRFGGLHNVTAYPAITPSPTALITNNPLYGSSSSLLFGGPFEMPIAAISRGGAWDPNTCLDWPINGGSGFCPSAQETYDSSCPSGNPYEFMGATGGQCVKMRVPAGGWCNKVPNAAESAWPCPAPASTVTGWNYSSYSQPFPLQVGDGFVFDKNGDGSGDPTDDEHFRVVAMDTVDDPGWLDIWVQRNAMWDYCGFNDPVNRPGNTGLDSPSQMMHASRVQALAMPPYLNGCTGIFVVSGKTQSGQVLGEIGRSLLGHGDLVPGTLPGSVAWLSDTVMTKQGPLSSVFSVPPPPELLSLAPPTFAGSSLPIGNGSVQAYVSAIGGQPWFADSNTLNNNYGTGSLASRSVTQVSGNIYQIQVLGTASNTFYKNYPMIGWAGHNVLLDVSGPSSASTLAATSYGMCYVYNAGECVSGSSVGSAYVNIPYMWDNGACQAGQPWANTPCVIIGWPGVGGFRQQGWDRPDVQGTRSRFLTYGFGAPGMATPYAEMEPISATQAFLPPVINTPFGNVAWLAQLPTWREDRMNRTVGTGITVQVPGGNTYVRVHFGYSRYTGAGGSPGNFYCNGRAEACNTNGSPYSFDSETSSSASCSLGCTIKVPAMAPNLVYWQIQVSSDGTTWTNLGDIQASTVQ
ncbi:MAG: hypothetical protein ACLPY2_18090 [Bryobacteraceae bacterium]|jgi:hypothetical protein